MIVTASLSDEPLDVAAHLDAVASPSVGATALFVGTVRDNDPDAAGSVVLLEYSAHPDAAEILARIAESVDTPEVRVAVSHRVGDLDVGGVAIVCAVSSVHRAQAYELNRELVERVKAELPVWKKQVESDGRSAWVGLGGLT
ncbi:molybdenum cofactor biosynthesis protein MoaE [Gordonia sp. HY442]|uniref:molybdenum cofactor biosynthesis protein MoaE n=1 Tax=Gordonia zhenghanii TaxID=2911516 RepID=UPI001F47CD0F|nr:molybdenum cofactor biosynthesis protein MoaE [Gordonia zhenghanii]MCF8603936.1 molybdenum cofactor biosynthesis protein MoaE [Gordonia zhenghanii]